MNIIFFSSLGDDLEAPGSLVEHYVALRAYERFLSECSTIPGEVYVENDISRLKTIATKLISDWASQASIGDDIIHEICRYGGAEIHSISAFIGEYNSSFLVLPICCMMHLYIYKGGCVAQEVIKLVTKQYKPIDNTFIYNGITSETATLKL